MTFLFLWDLPSEIAAGPNAGLKAFPAFQISVPAPLLPQEMAVVAVVIPHTEQPHRTLVLGRAGLQASLIPGEPFPTPARAGSFSFCGIWCKL